MRKNLSAEIYRCARSLLFRVMLPVCVLAGVFGGFMTRDGSFDDVWFVPLFVIIGAFISLHVGGEYQDNAIRNKIITGSTKTVIMLSKLIFGAGAGLIFGVLFLAPWAIVLLAADVLKAIPGPVLLWTAGGLILLAVVSATLFTVVGMMVSVKGLAGIINLALIFAVMFLSYRLDSALNQKEFNTFEEAADVLMTPEEVRQAQDGTYKGSYSTSTDDNGQITYYKSVIVESGQVPNPRYVKKPLRDILTHLKLLLPHGQIIRYTSCLTRYSDAYTVAGGASDAAGADEYPSLKTFPLYSCADILLLSGLGLILFRKKETR